MDAAGRPTVLSNYRRMTEEFLARSSLRFGIATLLAFIICHLPVSDLSLRTSCVFTSSGKIGCCFHPEAGIEMR